MTGVRRAQIGRGESLCLRELILEFRVPSWKDGKWTDYGRCSRDEEERRHGTWVCFFWRGIGSL